MAPGTKSALPAKETADLEQARKACKDFESILLYHMLSSMRKAFDSEEDSGGDFGGDVFKSMIDEQDCSLTLARAGGIGLATLLEQGLGLTGRASAGAAPTGAVDARGDGAGREATGGSGGKPGGPGQPRRCRRRRQQKVRARPRPRDNR